MTTKELNVVEPAATTPQKERKPPSFPPRGCSETDAAIYLGISSSTLRKARMEGRRMGHIPPVPYVRAGRRIIYLLDDLASWLERYRVSFAGVSSHDFTAVVAETAMTSIDASRPAPSGVEK